MIPYQNFGYGQIEIPFCQHLLIGFGHRFFERRVADTGIHDDFGKEFIRLRLFFVNERTCQHAFCHCGCINLQKFVTICEDFTIQRYLCVNRSALRAEQTLVLSVLLNLAFFVRNSRVQTHGGQQIGNRRLNLLFGDTAELLLDIHERRTRKVGFPVDIVSVKRRRFRLRLGVFFLFQILQNERLHACVGNGSEAVIQLFVTFAGKGYFGFPDEFGIAFFYHVVNIFFGQDGSNRRHFFGGKHLAEYGLTGGNHRTDVLVFGIQSRCRKGGIQSKFTHGEVIFVQLFTI